MNSDSLNVHRTATALALFALLSLAAPLTSSAQVVGPGGGPFFPTQTSGLGSPTLQGLSRTPASAQLPAQGMTAIGDWSGEVAVAGQGIGSPTPPEMEGKTIALDPRFTGAGSAVTVRYDLEYVAPPGCSTDPTCLAGLQCCPASGVRVEILSESGEILHREIGGGPNGPGGSQPAIGSFPEENGWYALGSPGSLWMPGKPMAVKAGGFYTFMGEDHPSARPAFIRFTGDARFGATYKFRARAFGQKVERLNLGGPELERPRVIELGAAGKVTWVAGNLLLPEPHRFVAFRVQPDAELFVKVAADPGGNMDFHVWDRSLAYVGLTEARIIEAQPPGDPEGKEFKIYPPDGYTPPTEPHFVVVGIAPHSGDDEQTIAKWGWSWRPKAGATAVNLDPPAGPAEFPSPLAPLFAKVSRYVLPGTNGCNPDKVTFKLAQAGETQPPSSVRLRLQYKTNSTNPVGVAVFDRGGRRIPSSEAGAAFQSVPTQANGVGVFHFEASDFEDLDHAPDRLEVSYDRSGATLILDAARLGTGPAAPPPPRSCEVFAPRFAAPGSTFAIKVAAAGAMPRAVQVSIDDGTSVTPVATVENLPSGYFFPPALEDCSEQSGRKLPFALVQISMPKGKVFTAAAPFRILAKAIFADGEVAAQPALVVSRTVSLRTPTQGGFLSPTPIFQVDVAGKPGPVSVTVFVKRGKAVKPSTVSLNGTPDDKTERTISFQGAIPDRLLFPFHRDVTVTAVARWKDGTKITAVAAPENVVATMAPPPVYENKMGPFGGLTLFRTTPVIPVKIGGGPGVVKVDVKINARGVNENLEFVKSVSFPEPVARYRIVNVPLTEAEAARLEPQINTNMQSGMMAVQVIATFAAPVLIVPGQPEPASVVGTHYAAGRTDYVMVSGLRSAGPVPRGSIQLDARRHPDLPRLNWTVKIDTAAPVALPFTWDTSSLAATVRHTLVFVGKDPKTNKAVLVRTLYARVE